MLAYYPAYLLTLDVISDISDILSGIPSEILSGVSSDILSGKLNAYLLTCDYGTLPASQRQRRRTRRRRRRSNAADIKSNSPHLTASKNRKQKPACAVFPYMRTQESSASAPPPQRRPAREATASIGAKVAAGDLVGLRV